MTPLLTRLFGRLPIGWLQLICNPGRLLAAIAGIAFANLLIFLQLGLLSAVEQTVALPYRLFDADLLLSATDTNTISDATPLPRLRMFEALGDPDVASVEPLYVGKLDWRQRDGSMRSVEIFGLRPDTPALGLTLAREELHALMPIDTAIVDVRTRSLDPALIAALRNGEAYSFEARGRKLDVVHAVDIGAGFTSDGYMIVSDQTFFALFPERGPGTPNHILVKLRPGAEAAQVVQRLRERLPSIDTQTRTFQAAIAHDIRYQTTQRPVGIIFGFGVVMGLIVGTVIVYQILSTDVADHLREYATFKAMGYERRFFLGIVFEQAAALSILGFIPAMILALLLYALMSSATGLPVAMSAMRPPGVFLATLLMCGLSGALATRRLEKADPAELF